MVLARSRSGFARKASDLFMILIIPRGHYELLGGGITKSVTALLNPKP